MLNDILRLIVPVNCPGCGAPDVPVCADCLAPLRQPARDVRVLTGALPIHWRGEVPRLVGVCSYQGPVRHLVVAWKDRGRPDLTPVLGNALARAVVGAVRAADRREPIPRGQALALVPVPSSLRSDLHRGQPLLLAALRAAEPTISVALAAQSIAVVIRPGLRQRMQVSDQVGLSRAQRAANLTDHLRWPGKACGPVILVDDVVTTGASLRAASQALRQAGCGPVLAAAVVAATPFGATDPTNRGEPSVRP